MFQVEANTLEEYFRSDIRRQAELEAVDMLICKTIPDLKRWFYAGTPAGEPGVRMKLIGYGSFHYTVKPGKAVEWPIIGLALQKNYITVYLSVTKNGSPILDEYKGKLGEQRVGNNNFSFVTFDQLNQDMVVALLKDIDQHVKHHRQEALHYTRSTQREE